MNIKSIFISLSLSFIPLLAMAQTDREDIDSEKVFEEIFSKLKAACDVYYDGLPSAYAELFAEDGTYMVDGAIFEGKEAITESLKRWDGEFIVEKYEFKNMKYQVVDDQALLYFEIDEHNGLTWVATEVYERKGNDWLLKVGHWSSADSNFIKVPKMAFYGMIVLFLLLGFGIGRWSKKSTIVVNE